MAEPIERPWLSSNVHGTRHCVAWEAVSNEGGALQGGGRPPGERTGRRAPARPPGKANQPLPARILTRQDLAVPQAEPGKPNQLTGNKSKTKQKQQNRNQTGPPQEKKALVRASPPSPPALKRPPPATRETGFTGNEGIRG